MIVRCCHFLVYLFFASLLNNLLTSFSTNGLRLDFNASNVFWETNGLGKVLTEIGEKAETILGVEYQELETWLRSHYGTFKRHRRAPSRMFDRQDFIPTSNRHLYEMGHLPVVSEELKFNGTVGDLSVVTTVNNTCVVLVEQSNAADTAHIIVLDKLSKSLKLLCSIKVPGLVGVEAFVIGDETHFIPVVNSKKDFFDPIIRLSELYRINSAGKSVVVQAFLTVSATKWKSFNINGRTYLAQASLVKYNGVMKNGTICEVTKLKGSKSVLIHEWVGNGFKKVLTVAASYPVDVEWCDAGPRAFLVIANSKFDNQTGSLYVYEVTSLEHAPKINFQLFQILKLSTPSDVHCFHSNNYLFLAVTQSYYNVAGRRYHNPDAILYRFNGMFFMNYQNIPALEGKKWYSVMSNTNDVLLSLVSNEDLRMFAHGGSGWQPVRNSFQGDVTGIADVGDSYCVIASAVHGYSTIYLHHWQANGTNLPANVWADDSCAWLKSSQQWASFHIAALESELAGAFAKHGTRNFKEGTSYPSPLPMLRKMVNFLNTEISHISSMMAELQRRRPAVAVLSIDDLIVNRLTVGTASTATLHNVSFLKFVDDALKVIPASDNWVLPHALIRAHMHGAVVVEGLVSGLSFPMDFAQLHCSNSFVERLETAYITTRILQVGGKLGGVSTESLLLTKSDQVVESSLSIDMSTDTVNLDIASGRLGMRDWSSLLKDLIYLDSGGRFNHEVEFESDVLVLSGVDAASRVYPTNLESVFRFAMTIDSPQTVMGVTNWQNVELQRDLEVPAVNDHLLQNLALVQEKRWHATNLVLPNLAVGSLDVAGGINGLKLPDDIVTIRDNQVIRGRKRFTSIEVSRSRLSGNETVVKLNAIRVKGLRLMGRLKVDLFGIATANDYVNCLTAMFHSEAKFDKLSVPATLFRNLVPTRGSRPLSLGQTSFSEILLLDDIAVGGSVGNLDLERFASSTLKTFGHNVVTGPVVFLDPVEVMPAKLHVGTLKVDGKYELFNKGAAGMSMKVWLRNVTIGSIMTELATVGGVVAGVDVNNFFWDTLLVRGEQRVTGTKVIAGGLRVNSPNMVVLGRTWIDGKDWHHLLTSSQLLDNALIILSDVEFRSPILINNLYAEVADGVYLRKFLSEVLMYNESKPVTWTNGSLNTRILLTTTLNEVKLNRYFSEVMALGLAPLPSAVKFENISVQKIFITGTIDGLRATDIVCRFDKNAVIRAPKWFKHRVTVAGDLHSSNEISDFNGRSLVTTLDTDRLIFQGNLIVTGRIDNIRWDVFNKAMKLFPGSVAVLNGNYQFEDVYLDGETALNGKFNKINLTELSTKMVTIDTSQMLNGSYLFTSEIYFLRNMAVRNVSVVQSATIERQSVDWWKSREESLKLWEVKPNFHGPLTVEGSLEVHGHVNRIDLHSAVVLNLGSPTYFGMQLKKFSKLRTGHLKVHGKIMGVDVSLWYLQSTAPNVTGTKVFSYLAPLKTKCSGFFKSFSCYLLTPSTLTLKGLTQFSESVSIGGTLTVSVYDWPRVDVDLCTIMSNLTTVLKDFPRRLEDFSLNLTYQYSTICEIITPTSEPLVLLTSLSHGSYGVNVNGHKIGTFYLEETISKCGAYEEVNDVLLVLTIIPSKTLVWSSSKGFVLTMNVAPLEMTVITAPDCNGLWFVRPETHGFEAYKWSGLQQAALVQRLEFPYGFVAKFCGDRLLVASRLGQAVALEVLTCQGNRFTPKNYTRLEHFSVQDLACCGNLLLVLSRERLLAIEVGTTMEIVGEIAVPMAYGVASFLQCRVELVMLTMVNKSVWYDFALTKIAELNVHEIVTIAELDEHYFVTMVETVECRGNEDCTFGTLKLLNIEYQEALCKDAEIAVKACPNAADILTECTRPCKGHQCFPTPPSLHRTPCDKTRTFGCRRKTKPPYSTIKSTKALSTVAHVPGKTSPTPSIFNSSRQTPSGHVFEEKSPKTSPDLHVVAGVEKITMPSWEESSEFGLPKIPERLLKKPVMLSVDKVEAGKLVTWETTDVKDLADVFLQNTTSTTPSALKLTGLSDISTVTEEGAAPVESVGTITLVLPVQTEVVSTYSTTEGPKTITEESSISSLTTLDVVEELTSVLAQSETTEYSGTHDKMTEEMSTTTESVSLIHKLVMGASSLRDTVEEATVRSLDFMMETSLKATPETSKTLTDETLATTTLTWDVASSESTPSPSPAEILEVLSFSTETKLPSENTLTPVAASLTTELSNVTESDHWLSTSVSRPDATRTTEGDLLEMSTTALAELRREEGTLMITSTPRLSLETSPDLQSTGISTNAPLTGRSKTLHASTLLSSELRTETESTSGPTVPEKAESVVETTAESDFTSATPVMKRDGELILARITTETPLTVTSAEATSRVNFKSETLSLLSTPEDSSRTDLEVKETLVPSAATGTLLEVEETTKISSMRDEAEDVATPVSPEKVEVPVEADSLSTTMTMALVENKVESSSSTTEEIKLQKMHPSYPQTGAPHTPTSRPQTETVEKSTWTTVLETAGKELGSTLLNSQPTYNTREEQESERTSVAESVSDDILETAPYSTSVMSHGEMKALSSRSTDYKMQTTPQSRFSTMSQLVMDERKLLSSSSTTQIGLTTDSAEDSTSSTPLPQGIEVTELGLSSIDSQTEVEALRTSPLSTKITTDLSFSSTYNSGLTAKGPERSTVTEQSSVETTVALETSPSTYRAPETSGLVEDVAVSTTTPTLPQHVSHFAGFSTTTELSVTVDVLEDSSPSPASTSSKTSIEGLGTSSTSRWTEAAKGVNMTSTTTKTVPIEERELLTTETVTGTGISDSLASTVLEESSPSDSQTSSSETIVATSLEMSVSETVAMATKHLLGNISSTTSTPDELEEKVTLSKTATVHDRVESGEISTSTSSSQDTTHHFWSSTLMDTTDYTLHEESSESSLRIELATLPEVLSDATTEEVLVPETALPDLRAYTSTPMTVGVKKLTLTSSTTDVPEDSIVTKHSSSSTIGQEAYVTDTDLVTMSTKSQKDTSEQTPASSTSTILELHESIAKDAMLSSKTTSETSPTLSSGGQGLATSTLAHSPDEIAYQSSTTVGVEIITDTEESSKTELLDVSASSDSESSLATPVMEVPKTSVLPTSTTMVKIGHLNTEYSDSKTQITMEHKASSGEVTTTTDLPPSVHLVRETSSTEISEGIPETELTVSKVVASTILEEIPVPSSRSTVWLKTGITPSKESSVVTGPTDTSLLPDERLLTSSTTLALLKKNMEEASLLGTTVTDVTTLRPHETHDYAESTESTVDHLGTYSHPTSTKADKSNPTAASDISTLTTELLMTVVSLSKGTKTTSIAKTNLVEELMTKSPTKRPVTFTVPQTPVTETTTETEPDRVENGLATSTTENSMTTISPPKGSARPTVQTELDFMERGKPTSTTEHASKTAPKLDVGKMAKDELNVEDVISTEHSMVETEHDLLQTRMSSSQIRSIATSKGEMDIGLSTTDALMERKASTSTITRLVSNVTGVPLSTEATTLGLRPVDARFSSKTTILQIPQLTVDVPVMGSSPSSQRLPEHVTESATSRTETSYKAEDLTAFSSTSVIPGSLSTTVGDVTLTSGRTEVADVEQTGISTLSTISDLLEEPTEGRIRETTIGTTEDGIVKCE